MTKEELTKYRESIDEVITFLSGVTREYVDKLSKDELLELTNIMATTCECSKYVADIYHIFKERKVWQKLRN